MEFIKPTVITIPKKFADFYVALSNFADDTGEDLWSLLDAIKCKETDFAPYINFEYEE